MKKILSILVIMSAIFLLAQKVEAVTIKIGPNADQIKLRYAGAIVYYDNGLEEEYWYINPETLQRFQIKDGDSLSRLLRSQAIGIKNKDLNTIPENQNGSITDYKIFAQYQGYFATQVEAHGEAWYVHPLDHQRYYIDNGVKGYNTIQTLALDISKEKLQVFDLGQPTMTDASDIDFGPFWDAVETLNSKYYKPLPKKEIVYGAISGLASGLNDPYTIFFTPKEKKDFTDILENSVEGIGAVVDTADGYLTIVSPLTDSPAEKAGLLPGDQVRTVDDTSIYNFTTDEATALIKGPAGTNVKLVVYRASTRETLEFTITRARIELQNVSSKKLENNIAYFKINLFAEDTARDFRAAWEKTVDQFTAGAIIDLRNNPGGYTSEAVNLADFWLTEDYLISRESYPDRFYDYISTDPDAIDLKTVVLINEGTASAAEIFTLSLQDYDKATVVGVQSFGKGTGQTIANYPDGSALKFTAFEWLGPNLESINAIGVSPDHIVTAVENQDKQLDFAKQLFR